MNRGFVAALAAALFLRMLVVPASADDLVAVDVGVVLGAIGRVNKVPASDPSSNCPHWNGQTIDWDPLVGPQQAYYRLDAVDDGTLREPKILSAMHARGGEIHLCGRLKPVLYDETQGGGPAPIGAACYGSSSDSGSGYAILGDGTDVHFENVGWDASAASSTVLSGHIVDRPAKAKPRGTVVAIVSARPSPTCGYGFLSADLVYIMTGLTEAPDGLKHPNNGEI